MYISAILVVISPVINSSLYDELRNKSGEAEDDGTPSPAGASLG